MRHKIQTNPHTSHLITMERDSRSTIASLHNNTSSSSTIRFLGLLKQPNSDPDPFELDESDVVWSSDLSDSSSVHTHSPPTVSNSPTNHRRHHNHNHPHQFHPQKSGLSAALSDDQHSLVRRKPTLNPSLSAASAAKAIPPLPRLEGSAGYHHYHHHQSAPVNVPIWPKKIGNFGAGDLGHVDEVDDEEEEEMVPPHVIVARSHVMTFSVLEGFGRTLKGRDLRRVRNAVFQKTGFID